MQLTVKDPNYDCMGSPCAAKCYNLLLILQSQYACLLCENLLQLLLDPNENNPLSCVPRVILHISLIPFHSFILYLFMYVCM